MALASTCVKRIVGTPAAGRLWQAAVVIQGPYYKEYTKIVIDQTLFRNPDVLIILSTYLLPEEETGQKPLGSFLSDTERELVNAGYVILVLIKAPTQEECPDFWRTNSLNRNLQRLTSFAGLRHAHFLGIEFSLKLRSDVFLGRHGLIRHLRREVETEFPLKPRSGFEGRMKGRIVVSGQGTITDPRTWVPDPFHVRDHWYFGYTSDLLRFFDITDRSSWKNGSGLTAHNPESSMTQLWIKDLGLVVDTPGELVARYMITEDAVFVEQIRLAPRPPGWMFDYTRYLREGIGYLNQVYSRADTPCCVTSHATWAKFYEELLRREEAELSGRRAGQMC